MFQEASSFNKNISNWDVSKVQDMRFMFQGATNFNQNIHKCRLLRNFITAVSGPGSWTYVNLEEMFTDATAMLAAYSPLSNEWVVYNATGAGPATPSSNWFYYCPADDAEFKIALEFYWRPNGASGTPPANGVSRNVGHHRGRLSTTYNNMEHHSYY